MIGFLTGLDVFFVPVGQPHRQLPLHAEGLGGATGAGRRGEKYPKSAPNSQIQNTPATPAHKTWFNEAVCEITGQ